MGPAQAIRLNTFSGSVGQVVVAVGATVTCFPVPAIPAGAGPGNGPEALCSKPKGYPFKAKAAALIL
jgi:hypothetical protein